MTHIIPSILLRLRQEKHWSQATLAGRSRVNKQTISRLERGETTRIRQHTLECLGKALQVDVAILTGEKALPEKAPEDWPWEHKSQLSMQVNDSARNALALVAKRYRVPAAQIVEAAPFLFAVAAELSLKRRAQHLERLEQHLGSTEDLRRDLPHLSEMVSGSYDAERVIDAERKSINERDLFGKSMDVNGEGGIVVDDFDESTQGPLVRCLQDLAAESGYAAEFESWGSYSGPSYEVCATEAEDLVEGDSALAEGILSGVIGLHKLPAELRKKGQGPARAAWARQELEAASERFPDLPPELAARLEVILTRETDEP